MNSIISIHFFSELIDVAAASIIIVGLIFSSFRFLLNIAKSNLQTGFVLYRRDIARIILLGIEFLIAGDILKSISEPLTIENIFILALIILIRTFLSLELQMEIDGKFPWQRKSGKIV